jgi:predicted component of type VI protein secretion system
MPKLILKLDDRELQQFAVGAHPVSIGRSADSHILIDNPAVSARHARVYREGHQYVLEDLNSTNGTFVNDRPVARHTLVDGDVVLVAKHTLIFTHEGGELSEGGADDHRPPQMYDAVVPKTAIRTPRGRIGSLKVIAGKAERSDYVLAAVTTMIGKADVAQIRLTGWFAPDIAAAISRRGEGFTITPMVGKVSVNGSRVEGRRELANGDTIEVSGLTLKFSLA